MSNCKVLQNYHKIGITYLIGLNDLASHCPLCSLQPSPFKLPWKPTRVVQSVFVWQSPHLPHSLRTLERSDSPRSGPLCNMETSLKIAVVNLWSCLAFPCVISSSEFIIQLGLEFFLLFFFLFPRREIPLVVHVSLYFSVTKWITGRESLFSF